MTNSPQPGIRIKVQRKHYERNYDIVRFERLTDDTSKVIARPVYKNGKLGRARTIGHFVLEPIIDDEAVA